MGLQDQTQLFVYTTNCFAHMSVSRCETKNAMNIINPTLHHTREYNYCNELRDQTCVQYSVYTAVPNPQESLGSQCHSMFLIVWDTMVFEQIP